MRLKHRYKLMEGYAPVVQAVKGVTRSFARQEAQDWCIIIIIIENDYRHGPLAEAIIRPVQG